MEMIESCVPPGFRFHPTEEELVGYYLKRKISSLKIDLNVIVEIDLYRIEPWDIQGRCNLGYEEQNEWYFFSYKDRKYPSGTRTNRATGAGFWKATGRDKAVVSKDKIIGMRKTLVYYKGRAPNGRKSDWIMHEYRLQTTDLINGPPPPQEEGWVVCRAFKKPSPSMHHKQSFEPWNNNMTTYNNSCLRLDNTTHYNPPSFPASTNNFELLNQSTNHDHQFLQDQPLSSMIHHSPFDQSRQMMMELPSLDSPSISTSFTTHENNFDQANEDLEDHHDEIKIRSNSGNQYNIDWKRFEDHTEPSSYACPNMTFVSNSDHHDLAQTHISHVLECFHEL